VSEWVVGAFVAGLVAWLGLLFWQNFKLGRDEGPHFRSLRQAGAVSALAGVAAGVATFWLPARRGSHSLPASLLVGVTVTAMIFGIDWFRSRSVE
jgi:hypothetical protein